MTTHVTLQNLSFGSGSKKDDIFSKGSRSHSLRKRNSSLGPTYQPEFNKFKKRSSIPNDAFDREVNRQKINQVKKTVADTVDGFETKFLDFINQNYKKFTEKDLKSMIQKDLKFKLLSNFDNY